MAIIIVISISRLYFVWAGKQKLKISLTLIPNPFNSI